MKAVVLVASVVLSMVFASCSPSVPMPKGTSKGHVSARLVQRNPRLPAITNPTEQGIHRMIQDSLRKQFVAKGLSYGAANSDLTVAYLVIYQEPGMTATYEDYFGFGRPADEIADSAHIRGAIKSKRPDFFQRAGILVDVIDSRTNKLIYRDFADGDVVRGASAETRAARIDAGVARALAGFFR